MNYKYSLEIVENPFNSDDFKGDELSELDESILKVSHSS